jgi:hypothetical protein
MSMNCLFHASVADMRIRMQCLPRRLRIAHLRALMARLPSRSIRRPGLAALLRDELAAQPQCEDRSA